MKPGLSMLPLFAAVALIPTVLESVASASHTTTNIRRKEARGGLACRT